MPLDTERKRRAAAAAAGVPFITVPPKADGKIDAGDRAILAGVYSVSGQADAGITAAARRDGARARTRIR